MRDIVWELLRTCHVATRPRQKQFQLVHTHTHKHTRTGSVASILYSYTLNIACNNQKRKPQSRVQKLQTELSSRRQQSALNQRTPTPSTPRTLSPFPLLLPSSLSSSLLLPTCLPSSANFRKHIHKHCECCVHCALPKCFSSSRIGN